MNRSAALVLGIALNVSPALAAAAEAERLDLSVPERRIDFAEGAASRYVDDPPGTWYGDTSGRRAAGPDAEAAADPCPSEPQVSGSVSTGIGYSKRFGNSHWSSANVDIGRCYGEGKFKGMLHLSIGVAEGDGPGWYASPYAPMPMRPLRDR